MKAILIKSNIYEKRNNKRLVIANQIIRTMLNATATRTSLTRQAIINLSARSKTTSIVKFKKKSNAINELASDDTGIHSHAVNNICIKTECELQRCSQLCDQLKRIDNKGFFTHKPIAGKYCRFVLDHDANNNKDTQYYIKNKDRSKTIDANKAQQYYQNKDIKNDLKMQQYITNHNLNDKMED